MMLAYAALAAVQVGLRSVTGEMPDEMVVRLDPHPTDGFYIQHVAVTRLGPDQEHVSAGFARVNAAGRWWF